MDYLNYKNYLCHYGVKGMRWGMRFGQNSWWNPKKSWSGSTADLPVPINSPILQRSFSKPKFDRKNLPITIGDNKKIFNDPAMRKKGAVIAAGTIAALGALTISAIAIKKSKDKKKEAKEE